MTRTIRVLAGKLDRTAGSHVYNNQLVRRLAARGYRMSVVCFESAPEVEACAEVTVMTPPPEIRDTPMLWRAFAWRTHRWCRAQVRKRPMGRADIVIGAEHLFLDGHARRFPDTPLIYLPHSLLVDEEVKSYNLAPSTTYLTAMVYRRLQLWALRHAARTLRFTQHACDVVVTRYGRTRVRSPFVVNPMGTDLPQLTPRPADASPTRLLWVGQLIPRKRLDLAIRILAASPNRSWHFDIIGRGESQDGLQRLASELGVQDRVQFHGFQAQPEPWYRKADLLVFPSWLENSPVTMLEAMSFSVPCLAFRGDGVTFHNANAELIQDGVDGFLAASDEEFGARLVELIGQPERLRTAGAAARRTIEQRHTWEHHLDRFERLFEEMLAGPR